MLANAIGIFVVMGAHPRIFFEKSQIPKVKLPKDRKEHSTYIRRERERERERDRYMCMCFTFSINWDLLMLTFICIQHSVNGEMKKTNKTKNLTALTRAHLHYTEKCQCLIFLMILKLIIDNLFTLISSSTNGTEINV
jgi:hypothetical protein